MKVITTYLLIGCIYLILPSISSGQINNEIKIISPSGKKALITERREGIAWINYGANLVDIEYSTDEKRWTKIFKKIKADVEYLGWKIPKSLEGKSIKIRIIDSSFNNILAQTDYWINVQKEKSTASLFKQNTIAPPLKILPLGNSITFDRRSRATDFRVVEDRIGYRYPLYQLLNSAGINFEFIGSEYSGSNFFPDTNNAANAGFPGIIDSQLVNLLETGILNMDQYGVLDTITDNPYLETYTPDIVLLHIGTNQNEAIDGTNSEDVENILDEIDRVENLFGKSIRVIVARIINRVPNETFVNSLNNNIENMMLDRMNNPLNDAYPDNISIVDMQNGAGLIYAIAPDPGGTLGDMHDFLHPNDQGFVKMASKWFTSINSYVKGGENNMTSYWQFEETLSPIFMDKLEVNQATCTDCPVTTYGMNGNALLFSGENDLIVANDNSINTNLSGDFSVETWIQTTQSSSGNRVFMGKYNGQSTWWLGLNSTDSIAKFNVRSIGTDIVSISGTSIINDGNWHHIVGVKDFNNSKLKLYVDGNLENEAPTNFTSNFIGNSDLTIGSYDGGFYYHGALDEIALYDRSLLPSEIKSHYNKGIIGQDYCNDDPINISLSILLEGPFNSGVMTSSVSYQNNIPLRQPFRNLPWNYNGAETITSLPSLDPSIDIIDWVLVSLRSEESPSSTVAKRSALLNFDGSIVDLDGESPLSFFVDEGSYYIVVEHKNHLPIMSQSKILLTP